MGKTTLTTCKQIVQVLSAHAKKGIVSFKLVEKAIKIHAGSDPRTVARYIASLFELGFLEHTKRRGYVRINPNPKII